MPEGRKEWFRDHVKQRAQTLTDGQWDSFDPVRRSHWMTRTYVEEILRVLAPGSVFDDDEDLEACFTDGPKDAECDFICRHEGIVTIVQAKHRAANRAEEPSEFDSFADVLRRLHPTAGRDVPKNKAVQDILADVDWDNDRFELQFITLGKVNDTMRARESVGQLSMTEVPGLEDRVNLELLDEGNLNDRLRDAISAAEGIQEPIELRFTPTSDDGQPWLTYETTGGKRAWVGMVAAKHLANLSRYRNRLFALNIREYMGDKKTNEVIKRTAREDPEDFFFYNNGMSAVATKVTEHGHSLRCDKFSIINGAQTFTSLVKAHKAEPSRAGAATVLLRVTEVVDRNKTEAQSFIANVTLYNNTQNPMKISDFRSNDPVQRALNKRFGRLTRQNGKQYDYLNKRTERKRNTIAISMEEFAQTIYAFRFGPADSRGGKRYLFDATKEGGYSRLFGFNGEVWDGLTEDQFEGLAGQWFLCAEARDYLKRLKEDLISRASAEHKAIIRIALERRWPYFFAIQSILTEKYQREGADLDALFKRLAKPRWLDEDTGSRNKGVLMQYCSAAAEVLVRVCRASHKEVDFVQRNWYRSDKTLQDILDDIRSSESLVRSVELF